MSSRGGPVGEMSRQRAATLAIRHGVSQAGRLFGVFAPSTKSTPWRSQRSILLTALRALPDAFDLEGSPISGTRLTVTCWSSFTITSAPASLPHYTVTRTRRGDGAAAAASNRVAATRIPVTCRATPAHPGSRAITCPPRGPLAQLGDGPLSHERRGADVRSSPFSRRRSPAQAALRLAFCSILMRCRSSRSRSSGVNSSPKSSASATCRISTVPPPMGALFIRSIASLREAAWMIQ